MMLIKKLILYIAKIVSWLFLMTKIFRREVDNPGPKDTDFKLPMEFSCSKIEHKGRVYKFSIGMKHDDLTSFALKRRGILGRWSYQLLNHFGIRTKGNPYFEIAPMNEFVTKNILGNQLLIDKLIKLFFSTNMSLFKLKWMFSVNGSLWVESNCTVFRFDSLLDEDMIRISVDLSNVLDELVKLPTAPAQCGDPLNLIKVNGFVRGLFVCAVVEFLWMIVSDFMIQKSEQLSVDQLMTDAFFVTLILGCIAIACLLILIRDYRTRILALRYNYLKFIPAVFFASCLILSGINSHADLSSVTLYDASVVRKSVSHHRRSGNSYNVEIGLPGLQESVTYSSKSDFAYRSLNKGDKVYIYIHQGALGYKWWNGEFYTTSFGLPRTIPSNT